MRVCSVANNEFSVSWSKRTEYLKERNDKQDTTNDIFKASMLRLWYLLPYSFNL